MQINISTHHKIDITDTKNLKKLKQTCDDFESEILNFYLKEALNSKNALFPEAPGEKIYKSMYQKELSKELSGNFGYSKLLFDYLKEKV
ncbi:MAG: rod-binding protein [Nautiliaceae bacterium]|jgi:Rod binding domain-containing protein